jgi:hypothetical protein
MNTTAKAIKGKESLEAAFDLHVRKVTGDPANKGLSNRAMLSKAFKLFSDELASAGGPAVDKKPAADGQQTGKKSAGGKKEVVPTLARIPASDVEETGDGGKFAALDRLADQDPTAYEKAFERPTPAEQEAYLKDA